MLPNEKECRAIAGRLFRFSRAGEDVTVALTFERNANTRFANNQITTSGASDALNAVVQVAREGRTGRVSLNETSDAALERAVTRAEEVAAVVPADPEYVGPLEPQQYPSVKAYDDATARLGAAERLAGVRAVIEPAARDGMSSSGFYTNGESVQYIANRAGNSGFFRSTTASFSATVRSSDGSGSGWAGRTSFRAGDLGVAELAAVALRKARDSVHPRPLEPGNYSVILEPAAVAGFIGTTLSAALAARAVEEGRSYFSKKGGETMVGEKVFHESVTIRTDVTDRRRPATPWFAPGGEGGGGPGGGVGTGDFGLAVRPVVWIEGGVLKELSYDRYWAAKAKRPPVALAGRPILEGGKETLESLIASMDRGLLVTNFWYIRTVNPQTLQQTGLTRDGVWLVEKGTIAHPVKNFRFNESPAELLKNVVGMTPAVRSGSNVVPAIMATEFTFTSQSDAV